MARPPCSTYSQGQRRRGRSRRHHAAHRRLHDFRAASRSAKRSWRKSRSSTRPATRRSARCAPAARTSRTSSCWSSPPTTASCRKRSKRFNHAKAAKVPILVAVNKIDHPNANSMKVRQQLQDKGLVPDDWGGDTIFVECFRADQAGRGQTAGNDFAPGRFAGAQGQSGPASQRQRDRIRPGPVAPLRPCLVRRGTLRVGGIVTYAAAEY